MTEEKSSESAIEPAGIGGWLIVLLVGQFLSAAWVLFTITKDVGSYKTLPTQAHLAIDLELTLYVVLLLLIVWATVELFRRRRSFPTWWKIMGVTALLVPIIDTVMVALMLNVSFDLAFVLRQATGTFQTLVSVVIWWLYLNLSVRVKNTFVK